MPASKDGGAALPRPIEATAGARSERLLRLPEIPYQRLRFTLAAREAARLPEYHGSMLRGAFGHALRRAVCAVGPSQACESCSLRRACIYTRIFETFIEGSPPPFLKGLHTAPRPYVFEPSGGSRELATGERLEFDMILIGQAVDLAPFAVLAVERMAAAGLGRARHRFALAGVAHLAAGGDWTAFTADNAAQPLPAMVLGSTTDVAPPRARLHFITPTRIKAHDHLMPSVNIRGLVFAMLRRTLEIAHCHVPGETVDWTIHPLLEHASSVHTIASDLHWQDWERYSNRQQTRMAMGGFVGTMDLKGDLAPLWSLFRAAEVLHVGKGATFGLGKIQVLAL